MSNCIMINCISELLPPAKSNGADVQLMHGVRGDHALRTILNIFTNIIRHITHFTNRFIQCRQNTVVSLMGSIQRCIFWNKTGRIFYRPACEKTYSDRIISTEKNERYNHHDNLAQVRKSEKTLQYSNWCEPIEASMCDNYNNFNYNFYQRFGKGIKKHQYI